MAGTEYRIVLDGEPMVPCVDALLWQARQSAEPAVVAWLTRLREGLVRVEAEAGNKGRQPLRRD